MHAIPAPSVRALRLRTVALLIPIFDSDHPSTDMREMFLARRLNLEAARRHGQSQACRWVKFLLQAGGGKLKFEIAYNSDASEFAYFPDRRRNIPIVWFGFVTNPPTWREQEVDRTIHRAALAEQVKDLFNISSIQHTYQALP